MPISYQFIDRETDEPKQLNDIDRELCQQFGHEYSHKTFCQQFQSLRMIGIAMVLRTSECETNPNNVANYFATTDVDYSQDERDFVSNFFTKYNFKAWR